MTKDSFVSVKRVPLSSATLKKIECGCKTSADIDHIDVGYVDMWLDFCPLHQAAPDLLEALEVILNTPDLLDVIQDSLTGEIAGTSETQAITYMREIARLAIAKAKKDASA